MITTPQAVRQQLAYEFFRSLRPARAVPYSQCLLWADLITSIADTVDTTGKTIGQDPFVEFVADKLLLDWRRASVAIVNSV